MSELDMHRARAQTGILGLGYSRARLFPGSVILGLRYSRAQSFPLSKIVDTVIDIVAVLVIDNTDSALSITNAATMSITVSTIFDSGNNRARE